METTTTTPTRPAPKPKWLRVKLPTGKKYTELRGLVEQYKLNTICTSGSCPNMGECWTEGTATFMILGNICTRSCGFCGVKTGRPEMVDWDEPEKVARSIKIMNIKHAVWIIPIVTLVISIRLFGYDVAQEEAAFDLGASRWQVAREITLPALWPGIFSGALFAFLLSWSNLPVSVFTSGADTTLPEWLFSSGTARTTTAKQRRDYPGRISNQHHEALNRANELIGRKQFADAVRDVEPFGRGVQSLDLGGGHFPEFFFSRVLIARVT